MKINASSADPMYIYLRRDEFSKVEDKAFPLFRPGKTWGAFGSR